MTKYLPKKCAPGSLYLFSVSDGESVFRFGLNEALLLEEISATQLKKLETALDAIFKRVGIDIEFSKHFGERLNDPRNVKPITAMEIIDIFEKVYAKHAKTFKTLPDDMEAIIKDITSKINMPFVLDWNQKSGLLELRFKTVMRKPNFATPNQVFSVQT